MFLLLAFVLLLVLNSPWNIVGFGTCFVLFIGELLFWNRTVRRKPQPSARTRWSAGKPR